MAYITTIDPTLATGELDDLYRRIAGTRGGVADVHQVQSLNPRAMAAHFDFYKAVMFQPSMLSRRDREAIAVEVSRANGCAYCVAHHTAALDGLPGAETPPALLAWARRLAVEPASADVGDVDELRRLGLDDRAILDAVLTVGYFCFVNRLVLATGLRVEAGFEATCRPELEG
jgi:AhpD family alkylhydroperoxidase